MSILLQLEFFFSFSYGCRFVLWNLVKLIGSFEGRVFDEREITFSIGEIPEDEVISGIQKALTHFGKGETSR